MAMNNSSSSSSSSSLKLNVDRLKCEHELVIVQVQEDFNLERAVCNHGFFMMAPNRWIPSFKSLVRPLRLNNSRYHPLVTVCITHNTTQGFLSVTVLHSKLQQQQPLSTDEREQIRAQVSRMLRISDRDDIVVKEFHSLLPEANKLGFGRIFRSPDLFEDIVKSLLLCNCTWSRSLQMAEALCHLPQSNNPLSKRKRSSTTVDNTNKESCCWMFKFQSMPNFPTPKDITRLGEEKLNKLCNLGYRAPIIIRVAQSIENGSLDLGDLGSSYHIIRQRLRLIDGFGPFVVANITMCLGFYQDIPVDTETIRHLEEVHGKTGLNIRSKNAQLRDVISEIYDKYAPFQCLAYWMEHVEYYEKNLGKLSELPHSKYKYVSNNKISLQP